MSNNIIVQNQILSRVGIPRQVLKDGSQVSVRIVNDKGGGRYEGLVAGTKVNITSAQNYAKGDIFTGNIKVRDGQIFIVPKRADGVIQNQEVKFTLIESSQNAQNVFEQVTDPKLFSFIQNLGLIPDNLSYNIILNFKQLGMKFMPELMNKIYDMAKKYPGKERRALEIISNLLSKGVSVTEDEVDSLLLKIYSEEDFSTPQQNNKAVLPSQTQTDLFFKEMIKDFFKDIFFTEGEEESDCDILSISNTLGSRKDASGIGSWLLFPFEIQNNNEKEGKGIFRILLSNEKKIIKFCIGCEYGQSDYNFCLLFENNKCNLIKVNVEKDGQDIKDKDSFMLEFNGRIAKRYPLIKTQWEEKQKIIDNASALEEIFTLGGTV